MTTNTETMLTVAERLRIARTRYGATVNELAAAVNRHRNVVSRWENGEVEPPLWALRAYVDNTDASMEWLSAESGPPPPKRVIDGYPTAEQLVFFDQPVFTTVFTETVIETVIDLRDVPEVTVATHCHQDAA